MSRRNAFAILVLCVFVTSGPFLPSVSAQNVTISDLRYPAQVFITSLSSSVRVDFRVTYSGASGGQYLAFGVFDRDLETFYSAEFAHGRGTASPDRCESDTSGDAACAVVLKKGSGYEDVTFYLDLYQRKYYRLQAVAMLFTSSVSPLYKTRTTADFSINVRDKLALTIRAPYDVHVTVDGIEQPPGNVFLDVYPGSHHISVPEVVEISNTTRLRFAGWSDGKNATERTETLNDDITIAAIFVRQYRLTLTSNPSELVTSLIGSGWHDEKSTTRFSAPLRGPMSGYLGILGGKWSFQGWYEEDGHLLTDSNNGTIVMTSASRLQARWRADLTIPLGVIAVFAVVIVAAIVLMRKRGISIAKAVRRSRSIISQGESVEGQPAQTQVETDFAPFGSVSFRSQIESPIEAAPAEQITRLGPAPSREGAIAKPTKFCRYCGAEILRSSKFCEECGKNLV